MYSTDTKLDAMTLVAYYKSRFQIEFLFRDAKQHVGLTHCQSTRKEAINLHVNASMTALNLLKIEDRNAKQTDEATVISIASWKRRKFNQHLMDRLFDELDLDLSCGKVARIYERYRDYGYMKLSEVLITHKDFIFEKIRLGSTSKRPRKTYQPTSDPCGK
ncbi:transposase [Microbulbifer okhotskensis]|uniref:transposase n=1 Tax=Microbulbifer okhotskensis TaxID=2926617 RepID=UPI00359C45B6